ncbi:MAG: processing protein [Thermosediminibacterales bacterium]|nr:processing protein [Thermosediminibacterales bacterium]
MSDTKYWVALSCIKGIGSQKFQMILKHFNSIKNFWHAEGHEVKEVFGMNQKICNTILKYRETINPDEEMDKINSMGVKVLTLNDEDYPCNLKNIYDPPPVLYVKGNLKKQDEISVAIVGSRKATVYGKVIAEKLARELSEYGITIVSGMAIGIDSCAHKGAISGNARTIAVLGTGIDIVYPRRNASLMQKIIEHGAVVTEFPLGTTPLPQNFPARNRIISGLSLGTIVVEASERSGALITADFALQQGREVFAVPGNVTSKYSTGCNRLIKQGAKLVEGVFDVLDELGIVYEKISNEIKDIAENKLNDEEKEILEMISYQSSPVDSIIRHSRFSAGKVKAVLTSLEMKGLIRSLPGSSYIRI